MLKRVMSKEKLIPPLAALGQVTERHSYQHSLASCISLQVVKHPGLCPNAPDIDSSNGWVQIQRCTSSFSKFNGVRVKDMSAYNTNVAVLE